MIGRALFFVGVAVFGASAAFAAPDLNARLWLSDLQQSEELISAAVVTADVDELKRQGYATAKLLGRGQAELSNLSDINRLFCVQAAQSLFNLVNALKTTPARALVLAKSDAATYHQNVAKCEKAIGLKGKRTLPF